MKHDPWEDLRRARSRRPVVEWTSGNIGRFLFLDGEHAFSLYVEADQAFHFDSEGRLRRAFVDETHYLRGIDGRILRKTRARKSAPSRSRPRLEAGELYELVHRSVADAHAALVREFDSLGEDPKTLARIKDLLARARRYDCERLQEQVERFSKVYRPLGVLPPDCYRTLILQATTGCSYNECEFCSLYQRTPYHAKTPGEFCQHVGKVKDFLGRALALRHGVFLGEANALEIPQRHLVEILEYVRELVPDVLERGPGGGIFSFSDVFHAAEKGVDEYRQLRQQGLERVYFGVESGSDAVLKQLKKPSSSRALLRRLGVIKAAGLAAGLIFLVGAGGREMASEHVQRTLELVRRTELDERDIAYLSPLYWPSPQLPGERAEGVSGGELSSEELCDQEARLARGLRAQGVRVGHYDLASFVYY